MLRCEGEAWLGSHTQWVLDPILPVGTLPCGPPVILVCLVCTYLSHFTPPPSSALNNCPSSLVAKLEVGTGAGTWGPESLAVEKGLGTPGRRVFLEHPLPLLHLVAAPDTSPPAAPQFLATSSLGLAMGLCTSFPGTPSLRQTAKYRHCQCWDSTLGKRKR